MSTQNQSFAPQRKREQISSRRVDLALKLAHFISNHQFHNYDDAIQYISSQKRTWNWLTFSAIYKIPAPYARNSYSMYFLSRLQQISDQDRMVLDQFVCHFIKVNQRLPTRIEVQESQSKLCNSYNFSTFRTYCYNLPRRNIIKEQLDKCK